MTRVTIVTKLRLIAVIAPALLLLATLIVAGGLYAFGRLPRDVYDNQYAALRAAQGMEDALYKMDWGRTQPDGRQIVQDQQRRFVTWIATARDRAQSRAEADRIEAIAKAANPLFAAMRKAPPGDDSMEPQVRDLDSLVTDLIGTEEGEMTMLAARAEAQARILIAVTLLTGILVPWVCWAAFAWMSATLNSKLRDIRGRVEILSERAAGSEDLAAIDAALGSLGFPKPNPMLAE